MNRTRRAPHFVRALQPHHALAAVIELVAFEAPLYQVLAIAGPALAPVVPRMAPSAPASGSGSTADTSGPASLVQRLEQLYREHRRGRL